MRADVATLLRCPVCRAELTRAGRTLRCRDWHAYDIAKQGHVTLRAGAAPTGDTGAMVAAREEFLGAGHYAWLAEWICGQAVEASRGGADEAGPGAATGATIRSSCVVDAGAGIGYYLAAVLDRLAVEPGAGCQRPAGKRPGTGCGAPPARSAGRSRDTDGHGVVGIALDSSSYALRRAARAHPRIGAVGVDLWRPLPIVDGAANLVLNVFAPRNGPEFHRILAPRGALLTLTPDRGHLSELVDALGLLSVEEGKNQRLARTLGDWFVPEHREERRTTMRVDRESAAALVRMGPNAWHVDTDTLAARVAALPALVTVTAACQLTRWRRRQEAVPG